MNPCDPAAAFFCTCRSPPAGGARVTLREVAGWRAPPFGCMRKKLPPPCVQRGLAGRHSRIPGEPAAVLAVEDHRDLAMISLDFNFNILTRDLSHYLENQVKVGLFGSGVGLSLVLGFSAAYTCYYLISVAKVSSLIFEQNVSYFLLESGVPLFKVCPLWVMSVVRSRTELQIRLHLPAGRLQLLHVNQRVFFSPFPPISDMMILGQFCLLFFHLADFSCRMQDMVSRGFTACRQKCCFKAFM